jgi:hypothetical protein
MCTLAQPWFDQHFHHAQVKELLHVGRNEDDGGVGSPAGASDGDAGFSHWHQSGVGGHQGYLDADLCPFSKDAQRLGYDLVNGVGTPLFAHGTADATQGVLASKYLCTGGLDSGAVLFRQFLGVRAGESRGVSHYDDVVSLKKLRSPYACFALGGGNQHRTNAQLVGPLPGYLQRARGILSPGLAKVGGLYGRVGHIYTSVLLGKAIVAEYNPVRSKEQI